MSPLCEDCGLDLTHKYGFQWFMLTDKLWNRIAGDKKLLCIQCCERILGRPLRRSDFKKVAGFPATPFNMRLRFMLSGKLPEAQAAEFIDAFGD